MKKFFWFVFVVVVLFVGVWFSGLYFVVCGLVQVIEICDIIWFDCYVDFFLLCVNLCVQFNDYVVCWVGLEVQLNRIGVLLLLVSQMFIGIVVDVMVILIGIDVVLQGYMLWKCVSNDLDSIDVYVVLCVV